MCLSSADDDDDENDEQHTGFATGFATASASVQRPVFPVSGYQCVRISLSFTRLVARHTRTRKIKKHSTQSAGLGGAPVASKVHSCCPTV